jgi:hypothetical protein
MEMIKINQLEEVALAGIFETEVKKTAGFKSQYFAANRVNQSQDDKRLETLTSLLAVANGIITDMKLKKS